MSSKILCKTNIALIGKRDSEKNILIDYIKKIGTAIKQKDEFGKFRIVFNSIPLKVNLISEKSINVLLEKFPWFEDLDSLILIVNVNDSNAIKEINNLELFEKLKKLKFQGVSALIGIDSPIINDGDKVSNQKITDDELIEISKNLNFIYCFKINGLEDNISEIFQKVFEHVILKFKLMNPELYEKAKAYGLKIINAEAKK
ncbi:MAG: hypothetical protein ACTSRH_04185 [Promethearchaeota archaeon]